MRKDKTTPDHTGEFDLYFSQRHPDPTMEAIRDRLRVKRSANLVGLFMAREGELKLLRGKLGKDQLNIRAREKFRAIYQISEELGGIPEGRLMLASFDNLRESKDAAAKKLASNLLASHKKLISKWRGEEKEIRARQRREAKAAAKRAMEIRNARGKGRQTPGTPTSKKRHKTRG